MRPMEFMEDLPPKLKIQLSMYIHEARYNKIKFLHNKTHSFISWLCPMLKPHMYKLSDFIFMEGDEVTNINFLVKGSAAFVLVKYDNCKYINIEVGDMFGVIDIIGSCKAKKCDLSEWHARKNMMQR